MTGRDAVQVTVCDVCQKPTTGDGFEIRAAFPGQVSGGVYPADVCSMDCAHGWLYRMEQARRFEAEQREAAK